MFAYSRVHLDSPGQPGKVPASTAQTRQGSMTAAPSSKAAPAPRLDELIGVRDACERHGIMPWTIANASRRGELKAYRLPGNRTAYRIADLDAWAEARKAAHNPTCMKSTP